MTSSEETSLRRARREPTAFSEYYRANVRSVFTFITRRVFDADVAMELTAETFAQAFISRARFRGRTDAEAQAWTYRIAQRQVSRYMRRSVVERRAIERLGIEPPLLDEDEQRRLEDLSASAGLRRIIRTELAALTQGQRDALRLRVVEELSYADAATALGISETATRMRVMRGLSALAQSISNYERLKEETT